MIITVETVCIFCHKRNKFDDKMISENSKLLIIAEMLFVRLQCSVKSKEMSTERVLMGVPSSQLSTNFSARNQLTTIFLANSQLTTNFGYL